MDPAPLSGVNRVFLNACKNNKDIKPWIEKGADLFCIDPDTGCSGLHYACKHGNVEKIKYFLACGLGINARDHTGKTPLHYANESNNLDSIGLLIHNGADGQIKDHDGKVPRQLSSLLQKLDQEKLNRELIITCQRRDSFEIFEKRVNEVLLKGASIDAQATGYEEPSDQTRGFTPLLYACVDVDIERVKFLIEKGADVNKKSDIGVFPLYVLCSAFVGGSDGSKRFKITNLLLKHGADITLKGPKNQGLFAITVDSGDIACMKLFKEKGIDIHCVNDLSFNALSQAVWSNRLDMVTQLFEWGCKPICDAEGFSLLHSAVHHNRIEIAQYLITEKGFSVNDCTNDKRTALHLACETADLDMIKLVLNAGAKVDVKDKGGKTPLQLSSGNPLLRSHLKSVPLLFKRVQKAAPKDNKQKSVAVSLSTVQGEQKKIAKETVTNKKTNTESKGKNNQKKKKKKETNPKIEKKEKVVVEKPQKIVSEKSQIHSQEELIEVVGIQDSVETEVPVIEEKKEINKKTKEKSKDKKSLVGKIAKKLDEAKTFLDVATGQLSKDSTLHTQEVAQIQKTFAQIAASSQLMQQHCTVPKKEEITIYDDHLRVTTQVVWGSRPMLMPSLDNHLMNVPWSKHVIRKSLNPDDWFHNFSYKLEEELGAFAQKKILSDGATQYIIPAKVETPYGNQYEGNFEYVEQDGELRHRWFNAQNNKSLLALTDK